MNKIQRFWILFLLLLIYSCSIEDIRIKNIIDDSYYGDMRIRKMGDISKLDENLYSLNIYYSLLEEYITGIREGEYYLVRYIYKTDDGVYRIFYLIDYSNKYLMDKSSDPEEFYYPILREILEEKFDEKFLSGDYIVNSMMY